MFAEPTPAKQPHDRQEESKPQKNGRAIRRKEKNDAGKSFESVAVPTNESVVEAS